MICCIIFLFVQHNTQFQILIKSIFVFSHFFLVFYKSSKFYQHANYTVTSVLII